MKLDIFSEKTAKILSWVGLVLIVLGAVVFIIFRSWEFSLTLNEEKVGQFGDFIGGVVGTILAFVGVILYYIALTEQRKDIAINRKTLETQVKALNQQIEEFKAQTKEMQDTRTVYEEQTKLYREQTNYYQQQVKELKNQTKISSLQHFNSEFYNLLNVFINIKKDCLTPINNLLAELSGNISNKHEICNTHQHLIEIYTKLYYDNSDTLSIYFKTLYRLLKMIEMSQIEDEYRRRYAKTVRSQLSEKELLVLYYDYYSELGEKVRLIASKYYLLKHLNMMDKFEFCSESFSKQRTSVISLLNILASVFDSKIKEFVDIENEKDIHIEERVLFLGVESKYILEISDVNFLFEMEIKDYNCFNHEDVKYLFLSFLYDYFFFRRFKKPMENIFNCDVRRQEDTIECKYESTTTIII